METLHTFEGTELSEVLAQVHAQLGADAEIVSAAKVRRGGVGGFFAKQLFVVEARSMKAAAIAERAARKIADEPGGVLAALLAMADERSEEERPAASRTAAAVSAKAKRPARTEARTEASTARPPVAAALHQVDADDERDYDQLALPAAPVEPKRSRAERRETSPSYDSIFERALVMSEELRQADDARRLEELRRLDEASRLDETHGFERRAEIDRNDALVDISGSAADDSVVDLTRVPPRRTGGISPRPPANGGGIRPAAPRSGERQPELSVDGAPASGGRERGQRRIRPAAEVLPHLDRTGREVRPGAIATLDVTDLRDQTVHDNTVHDNTVHDNTVHETTVHDLRDQRGRARVAPAEPITMPDARVAPVMPDPLELRRQENTAALLALGLPLNYCQVDELTVRALSIPLEALPFAAAGVDKSTGVVAVVGGMPKVRRLSTYLAADATLACREMPRDLAAWLWIPDAGEARHRRSRWSWRERPVVVGVEGSPASSLRPFSMEMLHNLAPTSLRVIVEAAWSLDAMHHWINELTSLGVPMALDVVGVEDAAEPASVLHLGLPVATLDGLPANAQGWASIVIERLGEDDR